MLPYGLHKGLVVLVMFPVTLCFRALIRIGFVTGKAYAMPDAGGRKQFITDQHILAGIGSRTEQYPFLAMSNGKFTEVCRLSSCFLVDRPTNSDQDEFEGHKKALRERGLQLPRASALDKKLEQLRRLVAYDLTNDEITAMVDRKNFLRRKYDPETRERLQRQIEDAKEEDNHILANQLQEELDKLGKPSGLAFRTSLTPQKQSADSRQQERLAQLNVDNRRRNNEAVRRAQIQERQRAREADAKLRTESVGDDARLRTKSTPIDEKSGSKAGSGASTPALNGAAKNGPLKGALAPELAKLKEQKYAENSGIPTIRKPLMDDDIIASLDLDIDVDIE